MHDFYKLAMLTGCRILKIVMNGNESQFNHVATELTHVQPWKLPISRIQTHYELVLYHVSTCILTVPG